MTARHEKAKPKKQERIETLETEQKPVENQRKEKLSICWMYRNTFLQVWLLPRSSTMSQTK